MVSACLISSSASEEIGGSDGVTSFTSPGMVRLFFSSHPGATLAVKSLTLPLSGILIYGMLETVIFTASADERALTDFRELFFFLVAGVVLAYSYELAPPQKRR